MIVSAITSSNISTNGVQYLNLKSLNSKKQLKNADTTFNYFAPIKNGCNSKCDLKTYNSINEWKSFCHKQIANGKLDVIA